jgi:hypothetical protein
MLSETFWVCRDESLDGLSERVIQAFGLSHNRFACSGRKICLGQYKLRERAPIGRMRLIS